MRQRFNNLDELRLILAAIVACRHIIVISGLDDLHPLLQVLSSTFAVNGFFVLSGFLIFSAFRPGELKNYAVRRAARIYPAYFSVVLLATLVGLVHMAFMPEVVLSFSDVLRYLVANLLFMNFIHPELGSLFADHYQTAVNGALWTIKVEVMFYLMVPILALLVRKVGQLPVLVAMVAVAVFWPSMIDLAEVMLDRNLPHSLLNQLPGYLHLFAVGVALALTLSGQMTIRILILFVIGTFVAFELVNPAMPGYYVIVLPLLIYLVMQLPALNLFNRNDFSYGLYLIHFPVAQFSLIHFANIMPDALYFVLVFSMSVLSSIALWYFIERPSIRWGRKF
jgi:peptidoglycan/LPS O-acetylase OafA/YrhL